MKVTRVFPSFALVIFAGFLQASPYSSSAKVPDDMRELAQQAADAFKQQNFDAAAANYQTMIKAYPDCLYAWDNLGATRFQQGQLEEARKAFTQAAKLNSADSYTMANLGLIDYQLNLTQDAIKNLKAAISLNPNYADAHDILGEAYDKAGQKAEAQEEKAKARSLEHVTP